MQAYQTFTEYNQTGAAALFTYSAKVVPIFIPLILFAVFIIALLATYFSQRRLTTRGDFTSSFVSASTLTAIVAFIMSIIDGLINGVTLAIVVAVWIVSVVILFIPKD